jgi:hypothetical protein
LVVVVVDQDTQLVKVMLKVVDPVAVVILILHTKVLAQ